MAVSFSPEYTSKTITINGKKVLALTIYVEFEQLEEKWKKILLRIEKDYEGKMVTDKKNKVYYNPLDLNVAAATESE